MKNITVTIPDETYLEARVWAAQNSTSVSALVRDFLATLPDLASNDRDVTGPYPLYHPPTPLFAVNL
jgi:hypothetical protein